MKEAEEFTQEAAASTPDATAIGPTPATAAADLLAYSDHTSSTPVADYAEYAFRARWWPVAALVAAILAVTGGAAAAILWLGHQPELSPAPEPIAAPAAVTPGPLNGVYRLSRFDAHRIVRHSDGTVSGSNPQVDDTLTWWWAIRSTCSEDACTADIIQMGGDLHDEPEAGFDAHFTLTNGQWRTTSPIVDHMVCIDAEQYSDTWQVQYILTPLPDGTLTGEEVDTIITDECRSAGTAITAPVSATRIGDVPPTVNWNE